MKILAIESSCDETAAAVVEDGRKILSNVINTQVEEHKIYGGVVPEIASRRHIENISGVVREALDQSGCTWDTLDALAVTYAPGLIGALIVGVNYAKGLSYSTGLPLIPVHHLRGHIASNYLSSPDLEPPFLCLVVSGGHTVIAEVRGYTDFHILATTRDDAAGEALDKAARSLGLPYPGGLNLDRMCGGADAGDFKFTYPRLGDGVLDFSFSGLKTKIINTIHNLQQRGEEIPVRQLGASFMDCVASYLTDHVADAARRFGYSRIALAGGVSANSVLRRKMQELCQKNSWQLYLPDRAFCGDNAAMIASQGYYEHLSGARAGIDLNAYATMPLDRLQDEKMIYSQ
ncbi:MAG TPA: tRNA (adenosine(37)-N6)-threonylcarbamoyltransferase complex transferase subunit TsaD [Candidatus Onthovicinus excrementipullorum]|nr:tRNA (adenosine(37)-N6)-threonylcarbamoyltransferase complex transferase subunit TsaD [Candidatus Onthovicinus excrementipullorum]